MGRDGCRHRGAECLVWGSERGGGGRGPIPRALPVLLLLLVCSWVQTGSAQAPPPQCRIQKCTTDFVSLTTHLPPALVVVEAEFCAALRAYAACTQRTARTCRGNLVFHSALLGISDLMTQRNCSRDGPTSPSHPEIPLEPCNYHSRSQHVHVHAHVHGQAHVRSPPVFLFCGLFGDPHLRTFRDSFQTCKVEGAWPLVDNDYLSVQVTNVPVVTGSSATATNKITIIFKPFEACTDQRVYQAVSDHLPAAFVDGTISSGQPGHAPSGGGKLQALWILDRSPGRHVELHADYIGVTVIVRQVGRYLTLALRIPEELSRAYDADSQDLQLCVNGCPGGERIDRRGHLPLPRPPPPALGLQAGPAPGSQAPPPWAFSEEAAQQACAEQLNMRDIYYSSCVFDLLTTGDANFTAAALSAQKDMELLHPHRDRWRIFPRSGSAPGPAPQPITRLALLLLCALGSGLV